METCERRIGVMLTRWYDIDREVAALNELHRRMNRAFGDAWFGQPLSFGTTGMTASWPRANLYDTGPSLKALIQTPGLKEEDLNVEVHGDILTISGERKVEVPEGYRVHRNERGSRSFSRSFGLPCRVDPEKTSAQLTNGVLTITMEKHPESQPKKISVSVG
jgi:HSP20 family protein